MNYRGISLLSCVFKIFSSILNDRIAKHLESNDFLVEEQNGFRKGRSYTDHIFSLHTILFYRINQNKCTFVTFLDLRNAFDSVNRDFLFCKLRASGIDGKMYFIITRRYENPFV